MSNAPVDAGAARPVHARALAHALARLQAAEAAPWLHTEVARRMAQRLQVLRRQPSAVVDWWPRTGGSAQALAQALPGIELLGISDHEAVATRPPPWWHPKRWKARRAGMASERLAADSQSMVWANMLLHHTSHPENLLRQWARCLVVDGVLMFSTLGPGTLSALRRLYAECGWGQPMAALVDMHDIGDMLVAAGFADPVMDQETLRLTWGKAEDALLELRSLGSNAHPDRMPGLRTPRWRQRLLEGLGRVATQAGRQGVELEFEIVYGHAVKGAPRLRVEPESRIAVDTLRQSLRRAHPRPPV